MPFGDSLDGNMRIESVHIVVVVVVAVLIALLGSRVDVVYTFVVTYRPQFDISSSPIAFP